MLSNIVALQFPINNLIEQVLFIIRLKCLNKLMLRV